MNRRHVFWAVPVFAFGATAVVLVNLRKDKGLEHPLPSTIESSSDVAWEEKPSLPTSEVGSTSHQPIENVVSPVDPVRYAELESWATGVMRENKEFPYWEKFDLVHFDNKALDVSVNNSRIAELSSSGLPRWTGPQADSPDFVIVLFGDTRFEFYLTAIYRDEHVTIASGTVAPPAPDGSSTFTIYYDPAGTYADGYANGGAGYVNFRATPDPNVKIALWHPAPPPGYEPGPVD
jgi:hypothetical protein